MPFQLADLFEAVADAVPEREALVCGERRFRYRELDRRATRLAHALAAQGIGRGDHVGTYLYNGTEYVTAMIAAFKLGAVPININYRYLDEELRYLFHNADLRALIHHREFGERVARVAAQCPALHTFLAVDDDSGAPLAPEGALGFEDAIASASEERAFPPRSPDDLFIIYTGGTTGMPKGVMWRHEDLFFAGMGGGNPTGAPVASVEELAARAKENAHPIAMLAAAPLIHGAAQLATFIAFHAGNRFVLQKRFDAEDLLRLIDAEKVSTMFIVGDAMARPFADALARNAETGRYDLSSLVMISSAGAIFSQAAKQAIKKQLPQCALLDSYGSTETGFQGTGAGGESRSFGEGLRFAMNDRTVVLDDDLRVVEPGSGRRGRVALRGHVPVGYYNDPEKTAATFVQIGGDRYALTGDVAEVDADGSIVVFGRGSVCINTGGEKVFIEEVENALKSFAPIYDAVVVGVDDPTWGQRVAALVSLVEGAELPGEEAIRAHVKGRLAGYKVPRDIFVVDQVFRGPNGKADYQLARRQATELARSAGSRAG